LLDYLKRPVEKFQDFILLCGDAIRNIFRNPHYADDIFLQMDAIGVGSLPIVCMIGFVSGVILAMQTAREFQTYGAQSEVGTFVSVALVRELGPLLTALLVAGRTSSGIASELGSMRVTEQIDAMRALGTDPVQKLVTPRLIATAFVLPLLTIIADFLGLIGGYLIAHSFLSIAASQYWTSAWQALRYNDLAQGLIKPFTFAIIIAMVGCFYGLRTTGGTQGVGKATTTAVVVADIWIFVFTALIGRIFLYFA
jgi:phospholipid/cholesterol/gamma-HCH transport system permease protein